MLLCFGSILVSDEIVGQSPGLVKIAILRAVAADLNHLYEIGEGKDIALERVLAYERVCMSRIPILIEIGRAHV